MNDAQLAAFRALLEEQQAFGTAGIAGGIRCREIALLAQFALQEIDQLREEIKRLIGFTAHTDGESVWLQNRNAGGV